MITRIVIGVVGLLALIVILSGFYVVNETQQAIITQFGKPVGEPISEPGLKFKTPLIQKVQYFESDNDAWDWLNG